MWLTIIHWHILVTKSFGYYFNAWVGVSSPMQIMRNSIWFGERWKRLNINENWPTHILSSNMGTMTNLFLFPSLFFMGIWMLHHCFVLILHPVDGVLETIIHPTKYHSRVHGFANWSQTKVVNDWSNSSKKWCCMVAQLHVCTHGALHDDLGHYFMQVN